MSKINTMIVGLVMLTIGFAIGVYVAWQPLPMERLYKEYNHIRIYEDGSFEGAYRDGVRTSGCIPGALCQD